MPLDGADKAKQDACDRAPQFCQLPRGRLVESPGWQGLPGLFSPIVAGGLLMGLQNLSLPNVTLMALAGIGVVLLTVWCASRFEIWWNRR
jgi:hypothetical protein